MAIRSAKRVGGYRGGRRRIQPYYASDRPGSSAAEKTRAVMRQYLATAPGRISGGGSTGGREDTGDTNLNTHAVRLEQFYTSDSGAVGIASGEVPDGSRTTFELDYEPLNEMVVIFINGRHRPEVDYSVSAATITFDTAPRSDMFISGFYLR